MKFLHLSDLHLGKRVIEFSMLEDQKYILNEIIKIADSQKPDAVLIAGDVYDKGIPPLEAVSLFDDFLNRLVERNLPVLIISGNHDSPERISFGSNLMKKSGVYFSSVYDGTVEKVTLNDDKGPVNFYLLPYLKPSYVRQCFAEEKIDSFNDAVKMALSKVDVDKSQRNVLLAHQFVTGASTCESEELYVGGSENIDASLFDDFDYVALGHLHGPQKIIKENVRYCGSPLKYSFSECSQKKSVCLVELGKKSEVKIDLQELKPLRDMREIKGSYDDIMLKKNYENTNVEDYIHVTLTDEQDVPEGFGKIRSVYINLMKLDYDNARTRNNNEIETKFDAKQIKPADLFEGFFELQNNKKMDEEQKSFIDSLIEEIWEEEK